MRCKLLWAIYCASAACKGRLNERCRGGPFDGRGASIDGPMRRTAGAARGGRRLAYTHAVIVYNPRDVTHFIPYYGTRVFPIPSCTNYLRRSHARTRTHRPTLTPIVHPSSYTHPIQSLPIVSFLLLSYHATLCLLSLAQP